MTERKPPQPPSKTEVSLVRPSGAEYLTFVADSGEGGGRVCRREHLADSENDGRALRCVGARHQPALERIYADGELAREGTVKQYLTVQTEVGREVQRTFALPYVVMAQV